MLLFSYVGYKTLQKNYTGNTMNVKLAEESQQLNDVVVTALGIKREEKGLGYATENRERRKNYQRPALQLVDGTQR